MNEQELDKLRRIFSQPPFTRSNAVNNWLANFFRDLFEGVNPETVRIGATVAAVAILSAAAVLLIRNKRAKQLGDLAAGTLVVRVRAQVALSDLDKSLERAVLRNESGGTLSLPGIRNLSESDIQLIESLLERQSQMSNSSEMAQRLAAQMLAKMDSAEAEQAR